MKTTNYSEALNALKKNQCVARSGWNGKGMYLFLVQDWEIIITGLERTPRKVVELAVNHKHLTMNLPFIAIITVQGDIIPWFASQADMLAGDWEILQ